MAMLCWMSNPNEKLHVPRLKSKDSDEKMSTPNNIHLTGTESGSSSSELPTEFPPPGYRPTPINRLLVNALDLTAPASDALLKNRKNAWVQLAGHPGSFAPAGPHTIWKKRLSKENNETVAYQGLMNDIVRDIVPKFHREVEYNGEIFIEIEDLLQHFTDPSIMDIKMGTRTFLESEVKNPVLRKDLYEKMIKLDPHEPTAEEHKQKSITKLRYMQFRERGSSTSCLGFRIEALRMAGEPPDSDLKKVKTEAQVKVLMAKFCRQNKEIQKKLLKRLKEIRRKFEQSKFFKCHEVIGSSILILHDRNNNAGAWMIDFAKTLFVEGASLTHRADWQIGSHEDGYLTGMDSLIKILAEMQGESCSRSTEALNDHVTTSTLDLQQITPAVTVGKHSPKNQHLKKGSSPERSKFKRRKSEGSIEPKIDVTENSNHILSQPCNSQRPAGECCCCIGILYSDFSSSFTLLLANTLVTPHAIAPQPGTPHPGGKRQPSTKPQTAIVKIEKAGNPPQC